MSLTFKPQNAKAAATKRIMRDLAELDKVPIAGLAVDCPDETNPFILHCNVLINDGPYRGIMIHLILRISEDYPLTGPAGNIAPGLEFDQSYHAHIHNDGINGHALCNDLLTNYAEHFRMVDHNGAKQASGWSPGYTLSTALLQIVTFFADHDMMRDPSVEQITRLQNMVKKFKCTTCDHTYDKPNPVIVDYNDATVIEPKETIISIEEQERLKKEREHLQFERELLEKLTCGITKQNIKDDNICLGYPLLIKRDSYGRLWPEIILELISYDAYVAEIQKSGEHKLDYYEHSTFRSVTGKDYNYWLPLYINDDHFRKGQIYIQNGISIIHNGTALGSKRYDFEPRMALKVLTTLMNKSSVQLFNGQMFESKHAIEAYCHFLRLLMHFIDIYPQLEDEINKNIQYFTKHVNNRNKKVIPDIGEFLIQIALSTKYKFDEIKNYVYEEYFARQIYWIQRHSKEFLNLSDIQPVDLSCIFKYTKVSNHLLMFNLDIAETFIFPGVKQHLDRSYGYPPNIVVEKFQRRLKGIKTIDEYCDFIHAIKLDNIIKSPHDMCDFIKRSVKISNTQGYTNILRDAEKHDQRFDDRQRNNQQQKRYHNGSTKR
ncbi:unnamed protein product [Didymodactylos carnosus]|uniref:UBC core domain-containing protein n=1 Tax=Didymodactylos carnosus TaxID=1234261 RepID=A0A815JTB6_9BILA|nr:unnamed protein product [Didymodactylos carnosus]CAF1385760.1 unnamed protein product [Didymodactylos carnosus]CAF3673461.1 unnamed protein product [Didymodactylos carnosus]CAF4280811.1 unnamed protein product [Didymodactylos carnosus]